MSQPADLELDRQAEKAKALSGLFKQLVTLDTALLAGFALFAEPGQEAGYLVSVLLAAAPVLFLVSLIASLYLVVGFTVDEDEARGRVEGARLEVPMAFVCPAVLGFFGGLLCLLIPAWYRLVGVVFGA